jgi:hypothetical protein
MQIEDLLHVADEASLKLFVWGAGVVETLNTLLPAAHHITTEISGNKALEMLRALPPAALPGILAIQLNLATGRPIGESSPTPAQLPLQPVLTNATHKTPKVPLMIAGAIAAITIMLTVVISVTAVKSGQGPDEGVVKLILSALLELFKIMMDPTTPPTTPTTLF